MNIRTVISEALDQNIKLTEQSTSSYCSMIIRATVTKSNILITTGYLKSVGSTLHSTSKLEIVNGVLPIVGLMEWERIVRGYTYDNPATAQPSIDLMNKILFKSLKLYALYLEEII